MSHTTSAADSFESNIKEECKQLKLHIKTLTLKQKNNFLNIMKTTKNTLALKTGSKIINLIDIYLIFSLYCQYIICSIESIDIDNEIDFCYTTIFIGTNLLILWKNTIELLPHFFKLLTNLITELKTNSFTREELAESIILKIEELISETAAEAEAERARAEAKKKAAKAAKAAVKAEEVAAKVAAKVAKNEAKATAKARADDARAARTAARPTARTAARTAARTTARPTARPTARRTKASSVIIEAPTTMSKKSFYRFLPRLSGLSGLSGIFKSRSVPVHIGGTKRKKQRVKCKTCKTCKTYKKQATY